MLTTIELEREEILIPDQLEGEEIHTPHKVQPTLAELRTKTIVCYGDSITWGYVPGSGERYPWGVRWTSLLQNKLGNQFHIAEEGLTGRYSIYSEIERPGRNGAAMLQPILETHAPVDLLILFIGTNDVLHHSTLTALDAAFGVDVLVKKTQISHTGLDLQAPKILLVSPPRIRELSPELAERCHGNPDYSAQFSKYFQQIAEERDTFFLDASLVCEPSPIDGVHPDALGHQLLGEAITAQVEQIFDTKSHSAGLVVPRL